MNAVITLPTPLVIETAKQEEIRSKIRSMLAQHQASLVDCKNPMLIVARAADAFISTLRAMHIDIFGRNNQYFSHSFIQVELIRSVSEDVALDNKLRSPEELYNEFFSIISSMRFHLGESK